MSPAELTLLPLMKLLYVWIGRDEYEGNEEAPAGPQATRYKDRVYGLWGWRLMREDWGSSRIIRRGRVYQKC